jgi:hypothetical protein
MNCRYVQAHLSAYADMELTGAEQQRIRAHLECCIECSAEYETLLRVKHLVRHLPPIYPSHGGEAILRRLDQYRVLQVSRPYRLWQTRWWRYAWGVVAAALVFWWTSNNEANPTRPIQSDALIPTLTSPYPKRSFSFPLFNNKRSEPTSLTSPQFSPVQSPWIMPVSSSPFEPNPMLVPVVENRGTTGTLQPAFEMGTR